MNRPDRSALDLEAATDQLVDEVCQRLTALYALVNLSLEDAGPPVHEIRQHAVALVDACGGPARRSTANAIARALWPLRFGHAPPAWWATPLGALLAEAGAAEPRVAADRQHAR